MSRVRGWMLGMVALLALGIVSLAKAECNRLGCWEVQKYRSSSAGDCTYWNGAYQAYNVYNLAKTGAVADEFDFTATGETIPQYHKLTGTCTPACTDPVAYPAEAFGGYTWIQVSDVSQWFCGTTPNNPDAGTTPIGP